MDFSQLGIKIGLPNITGIASSGIFATIAYFLNLVFGLMMIIWIGYSIYAAYKIITSDMTKGLEEGIKIIKNVWIGISMGIGFFILISLVGAIMGVGDITKWHTNLSQCHGASGGFYFKDVQEQYVGGLPEKGSDVYCCKVSADPVLLPNYTSTSFKKDSWHYIVVRSGSKPNAGYFTECGEKF